MCAFGRGAAAAADDVDAERVDEIEMGFDQFLRREREVRVALMLHEAGRRWAAR